MNKTTKAGSNALLTIFILTVLLVVLRSCLLSPLHSQIREDINFMYSAFPIILSSIINLFEILYLALLSALTVSAMYIKHKYINSPFTLYIAIISIVFSQHILNLLVSSIIDGYIDLIFDVVSIIVLILIDIAILFIVAVIANKNFKKHFERVYKLKKAAKYLDSIETDENDGIIPFEGFMKIGHIVVQPLFIGAVLSASLLLLQRLSIDIMLGAPSTLFEIIDIIVSYFTDIIFGLVAYATSYFAASYIFVRLTSDQNNN